MSSAQLPPLGRPRTISLNRFHSVAAQTSVCAWPSVRTIAETFIAASMSGASKMSVIVRTEHGVVGEPFHLAAAKPLLDAFHDLLFELFQLFR